MKEPDAIWKVAEGASNSAGSIMISAIDSMAKKLNNYWHDTDKKDRADSKFSIHRELKLKYRS